MNEKMLRMLEYNKIIDMLVERAVSPAGKEMAAALKPMTVFSDIVHAQAQTGEAVAMSLRKGSISLGGLKEIRPQLKRAHMGGTLSMEELLHIGSFLYVCKKVKNYAKNENKAEKYEILDDLFEILALLPQLENEINRCILSEVDIADDASTGLRTIRREIKISNDRVREQLNSIINSQTYRNMLQDNVITIRNNRYCVPVKSEYRNAFQGMLHDQSNTGSTLFIEPLSVVQLNNKIKELQAKEKEEIEKILAALSAMVAEHADILQANAQVLTKLDFIFAKAALALSMDGIMPIFNQNGYINIKKGRHPLLNAKTVVPIDIYIGNEFTTLLITGPNTGGKTVALKTVGLFTLMGQAGLHIPAFDNAELAVFSSVYADIGDEQSIEQNLSTFSSHMTNVVDILSHVKDNALVLFDELGAGTDPTEGAALALSIIDYLHSRNIRTVITTHYSELKVYALSTTGVENACCEFSVESLRPTFKLLIGIPGKSNAFAISRRLGLQEVIIDKAREYISVEDARLEDVITDLEISKRSVVFEQERAEQYRKEAENLKIEVEKQKQKTQQQRENILINAKEEAKQIYQQAKEEADQIIKQLNREAKEKSSRERLHDSRTQLKNKISTIQEDIAKSSKNKSRLHKKPVRSLSIGDRVYVISFDCTGTAITLPDSNGEVMVQTGIMKIKVPLVELMVDESNAAKGKAHSNFRNISSYAKVDKKLTISPEIDCRGQSVEEGLGNIDKYIDDAYLSGLKQVTVIHGKGTGVLRNAVHSYLRKNAHVKAFRPGVYGEGDMGVTVVELK